MHRILYVLFFTWLLPGTSFGWGTTGHEVVGAIAERHLTPKALAAVQQLLGDETMASVSTWMDKIRSQAKYRYTNTWHWVTIPDGFTYDEIEKKPEGDVIEATQRMAAILKSTSAKHDEKEFALRALIHLVGDLHQPLHVGDGVDKGGNDLQLRWMNKGSNLHRVWDSGIIDVMSTGREDLLAQLGTADEAQMQAWQQGTPADWAHECMAKRPAIYTVSVGYSIGEAYAKAQWPLVCEQLHKAGVRLAWLLNEALG